MKNAKVSDISIKGHVICRPGSYTIVSDTDTVGNIIRSFTHHENTNYEVRGSEGDQKGKLVGQISIEHLKEAMRIGEMGETLLAMDLMEKPTVTCTIETPLPEAYQLFTDYDTDAICVIDEQNETLGMLEKFAVDHYIHSRIVELEHKLAKMES
jgi:CBS domain-containing protein